VATNGAYLTANFVPMTGDSFTVNLTRQMNLGSGTTSEYSIQSVLQPASVIPGGWVWSPKTSSYDSIPLSAVDTSETQHDTYSAFLSGIIFGVAGGALVALIQELVAPFRARRELRPPEPGG
jgi:hypothetical protein